MHISSRLLAAALGFSWILAGGASAQSAPAAPRAPVAAPAKVKERVLIQVSDSDPKTWNQALNVVNNLQSAYGRNEVEVEIVAFGNGIGMLRLESEVGSRIQQTLASGAHVSACLNTMRGRKLQREDMLGGIAYVPSGVVELVEKQRQGWAVIRP
jgi:intracellular sulfur oxidation DsrE/DsrF family protein